MFSRVFESLLSIEPRMKLLAFETDIEMEGRGFSHDTRMVFRSSPLGVSFMACGGPGSTQKKMFSEDIEVSKLNQN